MNTISLVTSGINSSITTSQLQSRKDRYVIELSYLLQIQRPSFYVLSLKMQLGNSYCSRVNKRDVKILQIHKRYINNMYLISFLQYNWRKTKTKKNAFLIWPPYLYFDFANINRIFCLSYKYFPFQPGQLVYQLQVFILKQIVNKNKIIMWSLKETLKQHKQNKVLCTAYKVTTLGTICSTF